LWRAVYHEGEVLECFVSKRRNKAAAKKFFIKAMHVHGSPKILSTDKLPSYVAAFCEIGVAEKQLCGCLSNNRCENSHLPFRRRDRAIQLFKNQPRSRGLLVITVKYTTTSIMRDIFKIDRFTNKNAVPLSGSGSKSALHRFV